MVLATIGAIHTRLILDTVIAVGPGSATPVLWQVAELDGEVKRPAGGV